MKSRNRLIAIIAAAVVLLAALTLIIVNAVNCSGNTSVALSPEKAIELYNSATEKALSSEDFKLDITTTKNTTVENSKLALTSQQSLTYSGYNAEHMVAQSVETLTVGQNEISITESFVNNTAYFTIDGAAFTGAMSKDAYIGRFAPLNPVTAANYQAVTATKGPEGTFIQFADPSIAESWCLPAGAQMRGADGSVQLDTSSNLLTSTYHIEYAIDDVLFDQTVTVAFTPIEDAQISIPTDGKQVTAAYLDAARDLEIMYGYLLQSGNMYAVASEDINCQAGAIHRVQKTTLDMDNAESGLSATIETNIEIADYSDGGSTTTYAQLERFVGNTYTISTNGTEPVVQADVTADQTLTYCQDLLTKNIILPKNIAAIETITENGVITLKITGSEQLAQLICQNACKTLYDDAELLNNLASSYKTNAITCYYKLDQVTGLPLAAGLDYSGEHTIEGFAYTLTYTAEIAYGEPETPPEVPVDETTPTEETTAPKS